MIAFLKSRGLFRYGWSRIRTCEGSATRFTVWPLWPLGYPPGSKRSDLGATVAARRVLFRHSCCACASPLGSLCLVATREVPLAPTAELAVRVELTTVGLQNRCSAD